MASDRSSTSNRKDDDDAHVAAPPAAPSAPPPQTARAPVPPAIAPTDGTRDDRKPQGKLSKKQRKLLKDAHRPMDSWERYRALRDILDEAIDLVDLADHKARFALIIMGALNALMFIMASQTDV